MRRDDAVCLEEEAHAVALWCVSSLFGVATRL